METYGDDPAIARLQALAERVACWAAWKVEVVYFPPNATFVRGVTAYGTSVVTYLLDTQGDAPAFERSLAALAGEPTGVEYIVNRVNDLAAEFGADPEAALTCICEFLGEYEHAKYLRTKRG
jgi:hypothetical protein